MLPCATSACILLLCRFAAITWETRCQVSEFLYQRPPIYHEQRRIETQTWYARKDTCWPCLTGHISVQSDRSIPVFGLRKDHVTMAQGFLCFKHFRNRSLSMAQGEFLRSAQWTELLLPWCGFEGLFGASGEFGVALGGGFDGHLHCTSMGQSESVCVNSRIEWRFPKMGRLPNHLF